MNFLQLNNVIFEQFIQKFLIDIFKKIKKFRQFFEANPFFIHCHFFVKANEDHLSREWFTKEAERIVRSEMEFPELIIQVNSAFFKLFFNG